MMCTCNNWIEEETVTFPGQEDNNSLKTTARQAEWTRFECFQVSKGSEDIFYNPITIFVAIEHTKS